MTKCDKISLWEPCEKKFSTYISTPHNRILSTVKKLLTMGYRDKDNRRRLSDRVTGPVWTVPSTNKRHFQQHALPTMTKNIKPGLL